MELMKITDYYGVEHEVNIDSLGVVNRFDASGYIEIYFSGYCIQVSTEEGKKILSILKEKNYKPMAHEETVTKQDVSQYLDAVSDKKLHRVDVRAAILTADFLDAESKIKMLVLLGV